MEEAGSRIRATQQDRSFVGLTEIDVKVTLKQKLDVDSRPYKILGTCHSPSALKALSIVPEIGFFLPCNVTVSQNDDGTGLRLRYNHYTTALFGEFNYGKGEVEVFTHRKIPKTPLVIFARGVGTLLTGTPPRQDHIGLLTDPPVYLNPGPVLGMLGEFIEAPELHSLRGLAEPALSNRVVSGTLELRLPLAEKPPVKVLGLGLGQFTAALFADFGQVWYSDHAGKAARLTQGIEIKGNIVIGNLPLLTLAFGQAGDQEAWQQSATLTYLRLGLVSPF